MTKRHDNYSYDLKYEASPEQKKRRAKRNRDRLDAIKAGRVRKGDKRDVHHTNHDTLEGIRIISMSKNRSIK